jgi:hypothetical protein
MNGKIPPLSWAGFGFMALALLVGSFVQVVPHPVAAYLGAADVALIGLAGLCFHPPWSQGGNVPPPVPPEKP